jgi:hypothetical protein
MKRTALVMAFLMVPALAFVMAQGRSQQVSDQPREFQRKVEEYLRSHPDAGREELKQAFEQMKIRQALQPDLDSENWKELAPDLGVWLYRDGFGTLRGRIFVRHDDRWMPVAVEGLEDLGPYAFPAK